ncbi:hypothetical protein [Streptomyces coffeae]|uniref:Uncharacterized protein n=1 Tax=Streptomyces coffeae TaxID=621382 RepID=A0ABS1NQW5_9ACTN|nr:hypothetical protein [Streptomyces coffeae]MBL1102488.1 hypothetical protein [Streptomyces coffeae]
MLTIHRVRAVRLVVDHPSETRTEPGYAVVVEGSRFGAIGPYEELLAEYGERARIREWDGVLTPGRYEPDGATYLEATYHPDPREAAELGSEPLTGEALAALELTDARWGASARRGLQRLFAKGTTVLTGPFTRPAVVAAVSRSGIREASGPRPRALIPTGVADFAVFAENGDCLVTALDGRLVHRRR